MQITIILFLFSFVPSCFYLFFFVLGCSFLRKFLEIDLELQKYVFVSFLFAIELRENYHFLFDYFIDIFLVYLVYNILLQFCSL
jgi:hypothetical protein